MGTGTGTGNATEAEAGVATGVGLTFRQAGPSDVARIVELVDSAYRGDSSRRGWTHEADVFEGSRTDPGAVAGIIADPVGLVVVAEGGGAGGSAGVGPAGPGGVAGVATSGSAVGELVGCCQLEFHGDYAYFGLFAIRPDRQATGLGKAVLAEAERRARAVEGVRQMRMTVLTVRQELIAYYVRRGYRRTGELTSFPYGEMRFGVPQRSDLEFELLVKDLG